MREKVKDLVIFGDSAFAEIAYEYFTHDSEYRVAGFTVTGEYLKKKELFGKPVVPFEQVQERFPPSDFDMHVALAYANLNRNRQRFYLEAKKKGYTLANYISSKAFVWSNVSLGDNCFIFENNVVQPFVKLGSNIVLWSGNHIGHHSEIGNHCFISSHVVVSGFVNVGDSCFLGVNATIANNIRIGRDCLIGAGSLIVRDIPAGGLLKGMPTAVLEETTWNKFNLPE